MISNGFVLAILLGFVCSTGQVLAQPTNTEIKDTVRTLLEFMVDAEESLTGASIHIVAPKLGLDWGTAYGVTEKGGQDPLTTEHANYISSVTKTFVATAILRLHEDGMLDIDKSMTNYLPEKYVQIVKDGGYDAEHITVRHLLQHTSGLIDFFYTDAFNKIMDDLFTGKMKHLFTIEEQLRMAMDGTPPHGKPGEVYYYSDTGYVLLGAILQHITGKSMAQATRDLAGFEKLGLKNTWWGFMEQRPDGVPPRPHQYFGEIDSYDNDPPSDLYGGGGLVSTPKDLAHFFHALLSGNLYKKPETLQLMLGKSTARDGRKKRNFSPTEKFQYYGLGVRVFEAKDLLFQGHGGWWGAQVAYSPELDATIGFTITQRNSGKDMRTMTNHVAKLLQREIDSWDRTGD